MLRDVPEDYVTRLQALTGNERDTVRWNALVQRYEFVLAGADGVPRSQFWCRFDLPPDASGVQPFRELGESEFQEALRNLERTFVGNPYDGAGTVRRHAANAYFFNKTLTETRAKERAAVFSDFIWEHRRQLRDAGAGPVSGWTKASDRSLS